MPVGPSHAGRSSSSSRSSSHSSRSSGSSRSYSSGGSGGSYASGSFNSRPIKFIIGHRSFVITPIYQFLILMLIFASIILGVLCSSRINSINHIKDEIQYYSKQAEIFESDNDEFTELISKAQSSTPGYHITTASFDNQYIKYTYDSNPKTPGVYYAFDRLGHEWHFIVYEYINNVTHEVMIGTTYTQFSASQINSLNGLIRIAYGKIGNEWWSINESFSLETNQDYMLIQDEINYLEPIKNQYTLKIVLYILTICAIIALIVFIIIKKSQKIKKEEELKQEKEKAEIREAQAKADLAERQAKQIGRVCEYCNSSIPDNDTECPNCGNSKFK